MFRILNLNRALSLHPGVDDHPVECELVHTSLKEDPSYAALSYCWDAPQPQHLILCNGQKLSIRHNLFTALLQHRHPENPITLWADAICINQEDLEERGRQVSLMKDIFRRAREVMIWLGEEADNSAIGMQAAQDLANAGRQYLKQRDTLEDLPHDDPLVISTFGPFKQREQWARATELDPRLEGDTTIASGGLKNQDDIYEVRYKASGNSKPAVQFGEDGSLLGLECAWVDTVEMVGTPMIVDEIPHGFPGILRLPKLAYMLDEWRRVTGVVDGHAYPTGEPIVDAFIQTLVGAPLTSKCPS
ncbi:unnamed protein product [Parascedosporium putredinis]|uniref:Heterokaryon incompatibility domain-containing protein n=1 Tax=Parascedosporium putredinis TaxID=1442378 RepID=A0A9P1HDT7_9PEZI|nr:unnamed protein product [Parascedosporium putredinis]CAI8004341.1 unnamed protein product [Parascedosporium putredinis]